MHVAKDWLLDQFSVDHHQTGIRVREGLNDAAGMGNCILVWREHLVKDAYLLGVD